MRRTIAPTSLAYLWWLPEVPLLFRQLSTTVARFTISIEGIPRIVFLWRSLVWNVAKLVSQWKYALTVRPAIVQKEAVTKIMLSALRPLGIASLLLKQRWCM